MIQNVEIIIEQFDNGITLHWSDIDGEVKIVGKKLVIPEHSQHSEVGKYIMGDVKNVMDEAATNRVKLTIKYESL
jgi:hypothetical protein